MRKIPSCELLDQLDSVDENKGILLYKLDDYGNKLFHQMESMDITEEDRVTIAEAYSEVDQNETGKLPLDKLDELFRACLRELPGYELRQIMDEHKSEQLTLVRFAEIFMKKKSADFANTFKSSIKEATGVVNKKNNAVEVEKVIFNLNILNYPFLVRNTKLQCLPLLLTSRKARFFAMDQSKFVNGQRL